MNLRSYLERINYTGAVSPTLETLQALHRAHLFAIPFENLDIHLKRPIVLDETSQFEKIVRQHRGGFCYEQNGLFAAILRAIGFDVTLIEARVQAPSWETGTPFDHLALVVQLDERWLVDVGFGDSFLEPLRLDSTATQQDEFCVSHDGLYGVQRRLQAGEWQDEYRFCLTPRQLADFQATCDYHQTSPDSTFTQKRVTSLATPTGRITLTKAKFIETHNGQRTEHSVADTAETEKILQTRFGIYLNL